MRVCVAYGGDVGDLDDDEYQRGSASNQNQVLFGAGAAAGHAVTAS